MRLRSWIPLLAIALACGGRSQEPPAEAVAGRGGASAGNGGAGGGSGAGGSAGASGSGPACLGTPRSLCIPNCATMGLRNALCVGGEWTCPDGVFTADCPPDSCALTRGECCDHATGDLSGTACGDDGRRDACTPPATPNPDRAACIPDYLGITDCTELDGQACETAGHECHNPGGCRYRCSCFGTDGGLVWSCHLPVC